MGQTDISGCVVRVIMDQLACLLQRQLSLSRIQQRTQVGISQHRPFQTSTARIIKRLKGQFGPAQQALHIAQVQPSRTITWLHRYGLGERRFCRFQIAVTALRIAQP